MLMKQIYAALAAVLLSVSAMAASPASPDADRAVRPFHVQIPDGALADLRSRIAATRWPDQETVADRSQGAQLVVCVKRIASYSALPGHA